MTDYKVTLRHAEQIIEAQSQERTLLEVMRDSQLPVRKACRNGVCGICQCRLTAGEITYHLREPFGLWEKDIALGYILPCIAYATSDIILDELTLEPPKL